MPAARLPVIALFALVALVATSGAAAAHGYQTGGEPAPFAILDAPPTRVVVHMSEPIEAELSHVRVLGVDGTDHAIGNAHWSEGNESRLAVDVDLPGNGTYTVSWEARWRSDGHDTTGSYGFAVGEDVSFSDISATEAAGGPGAAEVAVRALLFAGALVALGSLAFALLADRGAIPGAARAAAVVALAATGATALATLLHLAILGGGEWSAMLRSYLGKVLLARMAIAAALAAVLALALRRLAWRTPLMVVGSALAFTLLWTLSLMSHAAAAQQDRALIIGADLAHLVAGAVWVGALPLLVVSLRRASRDAPDAGGIVTQRFSRLAMAGVVLVVATGTYAGMFHLRFDPSLLTGTTYGKLLIAKVALVAVLLGFGAFNQFVLVPRARGGVHALHDLRRSASVEIAVALAVLVLAGGLTAASPNPPAPTFEPLRLSEEGNQMRVDLVVTPARVGINEWNATITRLDDGTPIDDAKNVTLRLEHTSEDLGIAEAPMEHRGDGVYVTRATLGLPGQWVATVYVQRPDAYDDIAQFVIDV